MFQAGGLGEFFTSVSSNLTAVQLYFRLPTVSFQLTGGTCEVFSVQNCLVFSSKADEVSSELLLDVPSVTKLTIPLALDVVHEKLKCVALPLLL